MSIVNREIYWAIRQSEYVGSITSKHYYTEAEAKKAFRKWRESWPNSKLVRCCIITDEQVVRDVS